MEPGDGLDNDCDGNFDEEFRDGKDNDQDGKVDEDLEKVIDLVQWKCHRICQWIVLLEY